MSDQDAQRAEAEKRIKEEELRAGIRKRPILASIIAVLLMLIGFLIVFVAIIIIAWAVGMAGLSLSVPGVDLAAFGFMTGGLFFIIGFVMFLIGIGLWKLKKWALYIVGIVVLLSLIQIALGATSSAGLLAALCFSPVFIIMLILLLYFLSIRKNFS